MTSKAYVKTPKEIEYITTSAKVKQALTQSKIISLYPNNKKETHQSNKLF